MLAGNILFNIVSDIEYEKAQELFVAKAAKATLPGGHIFIDYNCVSNPEEHFNTPGERVIWDGVDSDDNVGKMILSDSTYDKETGINRLIRRFEFKLKNGKPKSHNLRKKKLIYLSKSGLSRSLFFTTISNGCKFCICN